MMAWLGSPQTSAQALPCGHRFQSLEASREMEEQQWLRLHRTSIVLQRDNRK